MNPVVENGIINAGILVYIKSMVVIIYSNLIKNGSSERSDAIFH